MAAPKPLPLSQVRVLELGAAVAAPFSASLLADAGAQVIKFETERRPDNLRGNWPMHEGVAGRERSFYWHLMNRNKLELTLDLVQPAGRATFLDLVGISDVVVENFSAGTMERLGVPYAVLRRVNPALVMVSLSGFGATGPARSYVGYGPLVEAVTGFASLGGYAGGPPVHSAFVYTDYVSAVYAANLILAGLMERASTGRGVYFDLSQAEVALNAIPEAVLEYAVNGSIPQKREDRDEFVPVHGVYPCLGYPDRSGSDRWVALAARTEDEWLGLCRAMGRPAWTRRPEFAGPAQRAAHRDALDRRIAGWTGRRTAAEAAALLRRHGVPASPVNNIQQTMDDPQIQARGAFQENRHPVIGVRPAYASPVFIEGVPRAIRSHGPLWGEHNDYVCRELLGLPQEALSRLGAAKALR